MSPEWVEALRVDLFVSPCSCRPIKEPWTDGIGSRLPAKALATIEPIYFYC